MAGSIKQFVYVTDLGDLFAISRDESNMEGVLSGIASDMTEADIVNINYFLPSNVDPRGAWFASTTTVKKKKITLPRPADYIDIITGAGVRTNRSFVDPETGETFVFTGVYNENIKPVVFAGDTGLNDGDAG